MANPYDHEMVGLIARAVAMANLQGDDPVQTIGADCVNYLSSWQHAITRDTPGKLWWHLPFNHAAIARALKCPRDQDCAPYALAPFRFWRDENDVPVIIAAYPTPAIADHDWLGIETVLIWNPVTDTVRIMGDTVPQLFGAVTKDAATIYGSPRAYFTEWMRRRAQMAVQIRIAAQSHWTARPIEVDPIPGALLIGEPEAIRWPTHDMPEAFHVIGADPRRINRAILKSARLPRCVGEMRNAA